MVATTEIFDALPHILLCAYLLKALLFFTYFKCYYIYRMHNNRFFRENPKVLQVRVGSNHSRIGGEMVDALEVSHHQHH